MPIGTNDELRILVTAAVKDAVNDLGLVEDQVGKISTQAERFSARAGRVGTTLTRSLTLPLVAAGGAAIKFAADIERQQVAFGVFLGDVEKGAQLFEQLKTFSAETPLSLEDITSASQVLLAFGTDAAEVQSQLQQLGDVAQGNSEKLSRLAQAFGRVQTKGRASLEEINIFLEAGVPLIDTWAEQFDKTSAEIFEMISRGEIGFEELEAALTGLTTEGGLFEGMMAKAAETTSGKFSTAIDNVKLAAAGLGEQLLPIASQVLDRVTELAKGFADMDENAQKAILAVGGIAAAAGPAIKGIAGITRAMTTLVANPTTALVIGLAAAAAGLAALVAGQVKRRRILQENQRLMIENNDVLHSTTIALNENKLATVGNIEAQLRYTETLLGRQQIEKEYNEFEIESFKEQIALLEERGRASAERLGVEGIALDEAEAAELRRLRSVVAAIEEEVSKRDEAIAMIEETRVGLEALRDVEPPTPPTGVDSGAAGKTWQEWFKDITELAGPVGTESGAVLAARFANEFAAELERDERIADALGREFDISDRVEDLGSIISELLTIDTDEISEPFSLADDSIKGLLATYEQYVAELEAQADADDRRAKDALIEAERKQAILAELMALQEQETALRAKGDAAAIAATERRKRALLELLDVEAEVGQFLGFDTYLELVEANTTATEDFRFSVSAFAEELGITEEAMHRVLELQGQYPEVTWSGLIALEEFGRQLSATFSFESVSSLAIKELKSIGSALAQGADAATSLEDAFRGIASSILGQISTYALGAAVRLLFEGGLGALPYALGLLAIAGVSAIASGALAGGGGTPDTDWEQMLVDAEQELADRRVDILREQLRREEELRDEAIRKLDKSFNQEFEVLRDLWERNIITTAEFQQRIDNLNQAYEAERDIAAAPAEELSESIAAEEAAKEALEAARSQKLADLAREALALQEQLDSLSWFEKLFGTEDAQIERALEDIVRRRTLVENSNNIQEILSAARGGSFTTNGPQLLLVGDNPGGREHVNIEPLSSRGGGGAVVININAPVYGVEDLYEKLEEAGRSVRRRGRSA